jgi:hypothetical protein
MPRKFKAAELEDPPLEPIRPMSDKRAAEAGTGFEELLTPKEAAKLLRVSASWLAKARMRGDGPPFMVFGRSIRYGGGGLVRWMKSCVRQSTSER